MNITLSPEEAVVLFEFLIKFDGEGPWGIEDSAELRVILDLVASIESQMDFIFSENYSEILDKARSKLRDPSGTDAAAEKSRGKLALWLEPQLIKFVADEWRKLPSDASPDRKQVWSNLAFMAASALHKAGIEYEPSFEKT